MFSLVQLYHQILLDLAQGWPANWTKRGIKRQGVMCVLALVVCAALVLTSLDLALASVKDGAPGPGHYMQQQFQANIEERLSLFGGAATFQYPISVPPGTGGIQPNLALAYNSQSRWGSLGYGWSLVGLDEIARSNRKGSPQYDGTDTFVWNGEELVLGGDGYYHTQRESYARIQNVGGEDADSYWLVTDASGVQYRYGYTTDSRILAVGKSGLVMAWALDQVKDAHGNYMDIYYTQDTGFGDPAMAVYANGDYYPTAVSYTGNNTTGLWPARDVWFTWEDRPDVRESYESGSKVRVTKRLQAIEVRLGGQLVRKYVLSYTPGSANKSLLSEIKECGSDGLTCLPPTTFNYQDLNVGFEATAQSWGSTQSLDIQYVYKTGSTSQTRHEFRDINGDGLVDDVYRSDTGSYSVRLNDGSQFASTSTSWGGGQSSDLRYATKDSNYAYTKHELIDMDGDGLLDDVYRSGTNNYSVRLNTGSGFGAAQSWGSGQSSDVRLAYNYNEGASMTTIHHLMDVNGDGLPDDVVRTRLMGSTHFSVRLNTGSGFETTTRNMGDGLGMGLQYVYSDGSSFYRTQGDHMDVNDDGLPDVVSRYDDYEYVIQLNAGNGLATDLMWTQGQDNDIRYATMNSSSINTRHDLLDMNGDGLPDDVYRSGTGNYSVRLHTGLDFGATQDWGSGQSSYIRYEATSSSADRVRHDLLDMNGDGLPDDVYCDGTNPCKVRLNKAAKADLLTDITLPEGGSLSYAYGLANQFDNQLLPFPMWVVTSVTSSDGLGWSATSNYSYQGGLYAGYPDNEFRGFQKVIVSDPAGAHQVTTFLQDDTYTGLVSQVETYGSVKLSDYPVSSYGGGGQDINSGNYEFLDDGRTLHLWGNNWKAINLPVTINPDSVLIFDFKSEGAQGEINGVGVDTQTASLSPTRHFMVYGTQAWGIQDYDNYAGPGWKHYVIPIGDYFSGSFDFITFSNDADAGQPTDVYFRNIQVTSGGGGLLNKVENNYSSTNPYPGITNCYLADTVASTYEGQAMPKQAMVEYTYDDYGNVLTVYNHGDVAISGDERQVTNEYAYNTTAWIVGKVKHSYAEVYVNGVWSKFRESWSYYDDQPLGTVLQGNLTKSEAWLSGGANVVNTMGYDGHGNLVWFNDGNANAGGPVNANGHTRDITYDSPYYYTFVTATRNARDQEVTTVYDALMRPVSVTDVNGQVTQTRYDVFGRVVKAWGPGDSESYPTAEYVYGLDGVAPEYTLLKAREQSGTSNVLESYTIIDGLGRTIQAKSEAQTAGQWVTVDSYYDERGLLQSKSVPYITTAAGYTARDTAQEKTAYTYDVLGRLTQTTYADGTTTTSAYGIVVNEADPDFNNGGRRVVSVTDANNHTVRRSYDAYGNVQTVTEFFTGGEYRTHYQYNTATGELVKITDAQGNLWTFTYDTLGRKTAMTDPDMGDWSYTYDANGNLETQTDAKGQTITLAYDALNRITSKSYPSGNPDVYTYDTVVSGQYNKGHLVKVEQSGVYAREWGYDARGRTLFEKLTVDGKTWTTSFAYDAMDRITSTTLPDGEVVANTYNAQGLPASVAGTSTYLASANYNAFGQLMNQTFGNNVTTSYDYYDTAGEVDPTAGVTYSYRLKSIALSGGAVGMNLTYRYDKVGNVEALVDNLDASNSQSFDYDDLNRLISASGVYGNESYSYDALGNITGKGGRSYTYVGNTHRVTSDGDYTYEYDANGNMVTRKQGGAVDRTFEYNVSNMLTAVRDGAGQVLESYVYQGETRLKKTQGVTTTYYVNKYYEEEWGGGEEPPAPPASSKVVNGHHHTLFIKSDGTVWTWGWNPEGQVGDGTTTDRYVPAQVSALAGIVTGSGSYNHSLAVKDDGTVWAWGDNTYGQVGDGTTTDRLTPVQVGGLSGVVDACAGLYYSLVLKDDGTVWAWGWGSYGQLGDGTFTNRTTPVQVNGLSDVVAISTRAYHSLALKSDGTVWAWGWGGYGQLGDGTTNTPSAPVQVANLTGVIAIDTGTYHSLALKDDGTVWAWGYNAHGQLGDGTFTNRASPVQANGLSGIVVVDTMAYHNLALKSDGSVWSWGRNVYGELGDGTDINRAAPVQVVNLTGVTAIVSSGYHNLALKSDGTVWAWGYDGYGQLGDGSQVFSRMTPVQVVNLTGVTGIGVGTYHSWAFKDDGTWWAWGNNAMGDLGVGEAPPYQHLTPAQVAIEDGGGGGGGGGGGATCTTVKHYFANGQRIATRDSEGLKFNHPDHLGSASRASDASGAQVKAIWYDPWGTQAASTGDAAVKYTYTGKEQDSTGLFYYGARYYDPELARFITPDNTVPNPYKPQFLNRYSYVLNNPLRLVDPSGHTPVNLSTVPRGGYTPVNLSTVPRGGYTPRNLSTVPRGGYTPVNLSTVPRGGYTPVNLSTVPSGGYTPVNLSTVPSGGYTPVNLSTVPQGGDCPVKLSQVYNPPSSYICFTAGTQVETKDGPKNIEDIRPSDLVLSRNPETGEVAYKRVVRTFENSTWELVRVRLDGETIEATPEHPFWVKSVGWVGAEDLQPGMKLVTATGEQIRVERVERVQLDVPVAVYNFEVEGFHTYFVGGGKVLVHNLCDAQGVKDWVIGFFTSEDPTEAEEFYVAAGEFTLEAGNVVGGIKTMEVAGEYFQYVSLGNDLRGIVGAGIENDWDGASALTIDMVVGLVPTGDAFNVAASGVEDLFGLEDGTIPRLGETYVKAYHEVNDNMDWASLAAAPSKVYDAFYDILTTGTWDG